MLVIDGVDVTKTPVDSLLQKPGEMAKPEVKPEEVPKPRVVDPDEVTLLI